MGIRKWFKRKYVGMLVDLLGSSDSDRKVEYCYELGKAGLPEAVPALVELLDHEQPEVREAAARALGRIGDASASGALSARLSSAPSSEVEDLAWALSKLPNADTKALVGRLDEPDPWTREVVAKALSELGWESDDKYQRAAFYVATRDWDELPPLGAAALPALMNVFRQFSPPYPHAVTPPDHRTGDKMDRFWRGWRQLWEPVTDAILAIGPESLEPIGDHLLEVHQDFDYYTFVRYTMVIELLVELSLDRPIEERSEEPARISKKNAVDVMLEALAVKWPVLTGCALQGLNDLICPKTNPPSLESLTDDQLLALSSLDRSLTVWEPNRLLYNEDTIYDRVGNCTGLIIRARKEIARRRELKSHR